MMINLMQCMVSNDASRGGREDGKTGGREGGKADVKAGGVSMSVVAARWISIATCRRSRTGSIALSR